jgi:hypothetical protein
MVPRFARKPRQANPTSPRQPVMPDAAELEVALRYMDELGSRALTRIVCVYELSVRVARKPPGNPSLAATYDFGQFTPHIEIAASLLPVPIVTGTSLEFGLGDVTVELQEAKACLLVTPRGDTALVLDAFISGDSDGQRVAEILAITCTKRMKLLVDGKRFLDWLRTEANAAGLALPEDLKFGQNVHQCVFPGGKLLEGIRAREPFWRIINRVAAPIEPAGQVVSFRPPELNYPGITAVGHGRGVSVIAGFSEEVENTYLLIAIMLITGLSVLHRSRENLFAAMSEASAAPTTSTTETRALATSLSIQLNELQLDLEFGVESYLDSVIIPEFIIEAFQRSLCDAMGLGAALEHSSRMLERLASVIQAKRLALDAAVQEQTERFQQQTERRARVFATVLALVTLLAVPPALLLAFFALDGSVQHSLWPVSVHAGVYAAVWGPFIVVIAVAWMIRKFFKVRSPLPDAGKTETPSVRPPSWRGLRDGSE